jgi:asparagine synthase (glutamine-hydrolysing)
VDGSRGIEVLQAMTRAIARRGPDDQGHWLEDGVALGHRRLSIIDLSPAGHQPMAFEQLVTVFNGEIYNYREVRHELAELGYVFTSNSDTEVLLKAFHRWGPACVQRFVGMFAVAVYDRTERAMYLIRDRAGVKPLYYYARGGRLAFGSELRSLKPYLTPGERGEISAAALSEFLAFGYISNGHSIIESVAKLPQAHYLRWQDGEVSLHRYWDVRFEENPDWRSRSEDDLLDELDAIATTAFRYRMVADVPVGVFLSAGVDSSLVTSVLSRHYGQINTFTIGFDDSALNEAPDARRIAGHLGTNHHEAILTAARGLEILGSFYDIYDEPHGDTSCIPTTFVSQIAKNAGMKVVLSADGGDELFGGYTRYTEFLGRWRQSEKLGRLGRASARLGLRGAAALSSPRRAEQMGRYADLLEHDDFIRFYENMFANSSNREFQALFPEFAAQRGAGGGSGALLNQMLDWDFRRYMADDILTKVDRATMFNSIEGREPFLDQHLVEFAAQLPMKFKVRGGETKYLLKRLLGRYLPEHLYRLPKRGFAIPFGDWVRNAYQEQFLVVLERADNGIFNTAKVRQLLDRYRRGQPVNYANLWLLFSFQTWYEKWLGDD